MNTALINAMNEATDNNEHTHALMIKAASMFNATGSAFVILLQEIQDEHELDGELSPVNAMLRTAIDMKLRQYNEFLGLPEQQIFTS